MAGYSEDQLAELKEAFELIDTRGDGKIFPAQIGYTLRVLGLNPTESDVKECMAQFYPSQRISFKMFLPLFEAVSMVHSEGTADDIIEVLRQFDKDGTGFISSTHLRNLLSTVGDKLSDDRVEQQLQEHEDSQGNINYENFVRLIMQG